jgi:ATP-binding cassette subfamily B protein
MSIGIDIIQPLFVGNIIVNIVKKDLEAVYNNIIKISITYFMDIFINCIRSYLFSNINNNILFELRSKLYSIMLNLPIKVFDNIKVGELVSRIYQDTTSLSDIMTNHILNALVNIIKAIILGITIFKINILLSLVVISSFPLSYIIFLLNGKVLRKKNIELKRKYDSYLSNIHQTVIGIREIRSLGIKADILSNFEIISSRIKNKLINISVTSIIGESISNFVNYGSEIVLILLGSYLVIRNEIDAKYFIAFLSYSGQFSSALIYLTRLNSNIQQSIVSIERISELADNFGYSPILFGRNKVNQIYGDIKFQNVYFKYDNKYIINGLNLHIKPNMKVAIIGKSGSGKTTILNLLLRFYEPSSGTIKIDDLDITNYDEETLTKSISIVRQEPMLFNMTIKENLLLAKPNASQEELENACEQACIHKFIISLPNKYDTCINELSVNFSTGQKQRIAIARALLRNSRIILFDEATSALDNESQYLVKKAIGKIADNKTIIMISHRLSVIIDFDQLIVINGGRIDGIGDHSTLFNNSEIYRELYMNEFNIQKENST